jgi:hypothetical protein
MNIFVVSDDIQENAQMLDDKRLIKMILEHTQMLSTALHVNGVPGPYKITHKNHPCTVWASSNPTNWIRLLELTFELIKEYKYRFDKIHACHAKVVECGQKFSLSEFSYKQAALDPYANCSLFKEETDVYTAYKKTMIVKWQNDKRAPKWTKRERPSWSLT